MRYGHGHRLGALLFCLGWMAASFLSAGDVTTVPSVWVQADDTEDYDAEDGEEFATEENDDDEDDEGELHCQFWAEHGECEQNAVYMLEHCPHECRARHEHAAQMRDSVGDLTFYDLVSRDIDGNPLSFEDFRGKVVIITNVASYCGYTKSHYEGLLELWSVVKNHNVEILAFPCNQFGQQEPGTADEIKQFAHDKGVQFRLMEKINVNGPDTNLVYQYLKSVAGPKDIHWNFATYYLVDTEGHVQSFNGVEPLFLQDLALNLLVKQEL